MKKSVLVVPSGNGWAAVRPNAERASYVAPTQMQVARLATGLGKREGLNVAIHRPNGQIRDLHSYGVHPCPPRDDKWKIGPCGPCQNRGAFVLSASLAPAIRFRH